MHCALQVESDKLRLEILWTTGFLEKVKLLARGLQVQQLQYFTTVDCFAKEIGPVYSELAVTLKLTRAVVAPEANDGIPLLSARNIFRPRLVDLQLGKFVG